MSKRIMLKLSGEALAGNNEHGFDDDIILDIANQVKELLDLGYQIAIVTGGGNFWRGRSNKNIDRSKTDQIGMIATIMNCIYTAEIFKSLSIQSQIYTPFNFDFTKRFNKDEAINDLENNKVVFFAGGTGHPYYTTDSITVLRAIEIEADVVLLGKSIDGIYDSDPNKNKNAKRYDTISLEEIVDKRLSCMDLTSSIMALENKMPFFVFKLNEKDSIIKAAKGEITGTKVTV